MPWAGRQGGATLGVLIPPSIVLVVYGIYTGQSIGKLFFGNVIPSAIATVLIAATVFIICRRHTDWEPATYAIFLFFLHFWGAVLIN